MRRSRHKLQVSTFPFLAVLLCAMGSLILLLLVMDRRAKIVARNKVLEAVESRRGDRAGKLASSLAQAEAQRQADWERERDNVHQALLRQQRELREHFAGLLGEIAGAAKHLEKHEANQRALGQQVSLERQRLLLDQQELNRRKAGFSARNEQESATRTELERLTVELLQAERALRDLRDLKSRPSEAFSLVPYRGRHGDARRPIYIECSNSGLVIHPGATAFDNSSITSTVIREEVSRRAGTLVRGAAHDPEVRNPPRNQNAYVLFLVRPDGIENFYAAQNALKGYAIDYGYELVESYWAFDFSPGAIAANQPWREEGGTAKWSRQGPILSGPPGFGIPGTLASSSRPTGGGAPGEYAPGSSPRTALSPGIAAESGTGSASMPRLGPPGTGLGVTLGAPEGMSVGPPRVATFPGFSSGIRSGVPHGPEGGTSSILSPGSGGGSGLPRVQGTPMSPPGTGQPEGGIGEGNGAPPAGTYSVLASALPPSGTNLSGAAGGAGNHMSSYGSRPEGQGNSAGSGKEPSGNSGAPGNGSGQERAFADLSPRVPGQRGGEGNGSEGGTPGEGTPSENPGKSEAGAGKIKGSGGSGSSPGSSLWLAGSSRSERSSAPTLGKLLSNHDFVITLECLAEGVVLYPRNELYPMNPVANQASIEHALVQAIEIQIARRQASVRPGEAPYRPMIRLQIQPEGRRSYYWIYPVLEGLHLPMIRENVEN